MDEESNGGTLSSALDHHLHLLLYCYHGHRCDSHNQSFSLIGRILEYPEDANHDHEVKCPFHTHQLKTRMKHEKCDMTDSDWLTRNYPTQLT